MSFSRYGILWRNVSTVTSKVQHRRDQYIRKSFPEYSGNVVGDLSSDSPRRGKRLGGLFGDPSRAIPKLDGTEQFVDESQIDLENGLLSHINSSGSCDIASVQTRLDEHADTREAVSEKRRRKIKQLLKATDYAVQSKQAVPKQLDESPPALGISESGTLFPYMLPESSLGDSLVTPYDGRSLISSLRWSEGTQFVQVNGFTTAAVVTSSMEEYRLAKSGCIAFDVSFQQTMEFSGQDVLLTLDHFITAPIRLLQTGGCVFTAVVDTKGYVLTTGVVAKTGETQYRLITGGNSREAVSRYISQFIVYSKQTGLDVKLENFSDTTVEIHGPDSCDKISQWLKNMNPPLPQISLGSISSSLIIPSLEFLPAQPPMSLIEAYPFKILRHTRDQYSISVSQEYAHHLSSIAPLGGVYALDMLRMEQRMPRAGIDIPTGKHSPVRASLEQYIDMTKIREKILFGHVRISRDLMNGVTHKRVQLAAAKYIYPGCRLLSSPQRFPIGEITSCAWSPALGKRVCHAQIKSEYAVAGTQILVNVPSAIPESIHPSFKQRIVKQGNLQSVFRKLVPAELI